MKPCLKNRNGERACVNIFSEFLLTDKFRHFLRINATSYHCWSCIDFYTLVTYTSYITYGAVTLGIYSTFYHNNYGNYNFIADSLCDHYIFYVNESLQFFVWSQGKPFQLKQILITLAGMIKIYFSFSHFFSNR